VTDRADRRPAVKKADDVLRVGRSAGDASLVLVGIYVTTTTT